MIQAIRKWRARRPGAGSGFLTRLARDTRGNAIIIMGAALVPLLCIMGGGIDISRYYMAQARLQQACDSASLAGRRAMTDGTVDATVRAEATKFFNFNFPQGSYRTDPFTPVISEAANSTVVIRADTTMPMTILAIPATFMKSWAIAEVPLTVTCNAKQDFVNTDIMLVLDVTGSMDQTISGTRKIASLRSAVLALYDELKPVQNQLEAAGLRLRYGVIPYSSGINVGKILRATNSGYVAADDWTYQSRVPIFRNTGVTNAWCTARNGTWNSTSGGRCDHRDSTAGGTFRSWAYEPVTHDISTYVTGAATATPTRMPGTNTTSTWAGCIEERQTVNTVTSSSGYTIPSGAKDLNIDLKPTADKTTKWKPFWPEVEYLPSNIYNYDGEDNKPQWACPTEAKKLQPWERSDLNTYLNTLTPTGGTYHDNGMIWGARFISPDGIFSADNPNTYGNMPVSRFIIFMTDGLIDTGYETLYTTYGVERWDARVTPGGNSSNETDQTSRHNQRFKMMCNAAKSKNISIWVVAFASSLDATLTECASSASQASTSANQAQLIAKFVEIGKNIGSLRLTQ